ncbi:MAG: glycoside hydrolase family 92 protein, partial [Clostridia bacterium]|nr:glycoside hydrolase family 92 protein [Clostridia bacterium]
YRMFLFPRVFHEICLDGEMRHYSPANGEICEGPMYTDNGFWDTYKTVYPLYSLILSDKYAEMCEGFLNFYKEGGWLPRWMSPCAVNCMPGTAIDAVFGDAAVKGVVTDGKMLREMLESLLKHAENLSENPSMGRDGLSDYLELGYVSDAYHESVNKTLDYAYGDFCIGRLAEVYGDDDTAAVLLERAQNYRNLFDAETGFIRAKNQDGAMRQDFTEFDWGGDYTEGGPWQCSFGIYHDFKGYADLLGGREAFLEKVQQLFDTPPYFRAYGYNREIHEMSEMALLKGFGQMALSNQPSFHVPYLFSCMGDRDRTAYWVRKACAELFKAEPQGFPGDEDNGSMAGWYVFSALGFYPVCPGVDEYVIGSPCVKRAVIKLDNGKKLTVSAEKEGVYAASVTLNGEVVETAYFKHADLKAGGTLTFELSDTPSGQSYTDEQLPYSMS